MRLILATICLLTALFIACDGGNGDSGNNATPQATAGESGQSTTPPDVTPPANATAEAIPDPFAELQSYRYSIQLSGEGTDSVAIKGSAKAPDSIAVDFYLAGSDTPVSSVIIIGEKAWMKNTVSGQWEEADIANAESQVSGVLPKDFWGTFPMDEIVGVSADLGDETVNGAQARHYQIANASPDTLAKVAQIFGSVDETSQPEEFSLDLWRAVGGWPLKAMISATYPAGAEISSATISWEVSDVNSSAVSIEPPL